MFNIKFPKFGIIYILIASPIMFFCLFMSMSGTVSLSINNFAVDSSGCLYIGKDSAIEVVKDGKTIRELSPCTSRGYAFTIDSNDKIILSDAINLYEMDLFGNILSKREDRTSEINKLRKNSKYFNANDGSEYELLNNMGYYSIIHESSNSEIVTVYKMPIFDYIVKLLIILVCVSLIIIFPFIVYYAWKSIPAEKMWWK